MHENISQGLADWSVSRLQYSWFKEKQHLKPGGGIFPDVSTTGNWEDVGHITQIDWRLTTQIGCGLARGRGFSYLVCDYSPGGNKDGKPFILNSADRNIATLDSEGAEKLAGPPERPDIEPPKLPSRQTSGGKGEPTPTPPKYDLVKDVTSDQPAAPANAEDTKREPPKLPPPATTESATSQAGLEDRIAQAEKVLDAQIKNCEPFEIFPYFELKHEAASRLTEISAAEKAARAAGAYVDDTAYKAAEAVFRRADRLASQAYLEQQKRCGVVKK